MTATVAALLAIASAVPPALAAGAPPSASDATAPLLVLEIGPRTVPCDEVAPRRCFEAREDGESEWRPFQGTIEGFRHREGHAAVVLVREGAPPSDDPQREQRFVLVRVLAELPMGGASWVLERYGTAATMEDALEHTEVHFVVSSGGAHIAGTAGCNAFAGPVEIEGESVRIGPLIRTLRACDEAVMRQEDAVLQALEAAERVSFYGDTVAFAGDDLRVRFRAELVDARLTWTQGPQDPAVQRFNAMALEEAELGANWTRDPIRVALAFIDSRGAPRVDVQRRDDRAEAPSHTVVVVDEDGFLDDSVRGVRSEVLLAPDEDGVWRVLAATVATRCWRSELLLVAPGETCP